MKKKLLSIGLITVLCLSSVLTMTACGEKTPYSDYDLSEYVKVGEYKGLKYDKVSVSVSKADIEKEIDSRLESHAKTETVKSGTVKDGDKLKIDYTGKIDGKKFDGGTAEDADLTIGSGQFIDGFEEGLIGKEVGSKVTLDLKFPEDYGKNGDQVVDESKAELAGKPVTFEVTINSRQVEKVPEYNMDFVKEFYSDYDSLEAFEAAVKEELLKQKEETAKQTQMNQLWTQIVKSSELKKYPEEKEAMIEKLLAAEKKTAEDNGTEWEDYLKAVGYSEEELKEMVTSYAENIVFEEMVLYSIAAAENLEITDDEYQDYLDKLLAGYGMDEKTFESTVGASVDSWAEQKNLRSALLLNKVMDKVLEYGKEVSK